MLNFSKLAVRGSEEALRKKLIHGWNKIYKKEWEDSMHNHMEICSKMSHEVYSSFDKFEKGFFVYDLKEWDAKVLLGSIKALKIDAPVDIFEKIELLEEKVIHLDARNLSYDEFLVYWEELTDLLVKVGVEKNEILKYKPIPLDSVESSVQKQQKEIKTEDS